jgi:superfamily I DNA and/or RNA helicase
VIGLKRNIYFISHRQLENKIDDSTSKINMFEVDYLVRLCVYLTKQAYKPSEITVLTMYLGQMSEIKKKLKTIKSMVGVKVTTVDNYQGEENEFILLSLVRSNSEQRIGFLEVTNRVCVALSRARKGKLQFFYIESSLYLITYKRNIHNLCNKRAKRNKMSKIP